MKKYDYVACATKYDILCADGRVIRHGAFSNDNGKKVPVVWNHEHGDPFHVLGHAVLEDRNDSMYAYISFNETESGRAAKAVVEHGDIDCVSIFANHLKQKANDVIHGVIREVSLVLAGANPEARIIDAVSHDEESGLCGYIYTTSGMGLELCHKDEDDEKTKKATPSDDNATSKKDSASDENEETVKDVFDTLNEKQKKVVYALVGAALSDEKKGEDEEMKHNIFDKETEKPSGYLSHADQALIIERAKKTGSLRDAFEEMTEGGELMHSIDTTGMETATGTQTYGFNDPSMMFPDYRNVNRGFEWISRDMGWVNKVLAATHKTPFSRIKSLFADITEDEARARGYIKGNEKVDEVFTTLRRTTDPQTVYKKQKLDRDDIVDIVDFDVVNEIKGEMRFMLNEEVARAILIGDGRSPASPDKIKEDRIRPIATDVPLFNTTVKVSEPASADEADTARDTIKAVIRARKKYKGSGNPTFYTTEDVVTEMLLLEDAIGNKIYKTEQELATALRVKEIVTVEPMEGHVINVATSKNTTKEMPLIGVIVNLTDYNVGTNKGGEINMFDDFDIDFNQYKYLIETRMSGALVKPFSALTVVLDKATA